MYQVRVALSPSWLTGVICSDAGEIGDLLDSGGVPVLPHPQMADFWLGDHPEIPAQEHHRQRVEALKLH